MKKAYLWMLLPLAALVACEPTNKPEDPGTGDDPKPIVIPESFPKKHLIEHFTGEACGYCPYGMECIEEYVKEDTNLIWVSHHYGYGEDEYTIKENETLGVLFGVEGAPSVVLDRTEQSYVDQSTKKKTSQLVFHPGYLSELQSELEKTTYASVVINHTFDAATGELSVTVSGLVADTTVSELALTVLVKENNLIGAQADFYGSWEGWEEFRHNKVVRTFLTAATGDKVSVEKQQYTATFTGKLANIADANNCVVVAYITTTDNEPIINAEQTPLVKGTTGGEEFLSEGIKMVEVPEGYPETGEPKSPIAFDGAYSGTIQTGLMAIELLSNAQVKISGYTGYPLAYLYLFASQLAPGEYPINSTEQSGTVYAGYRDDKAFDFGGSMFCYAEEYYLTQGYIYPLQIWLLVSGKLIIAADGSVTLDATTLGGYTFQGTYIVSAAAPAAKPAKFAAPFRMSHRMMHADMPAVKYNLMRSL